MDFTTKSRWLLTWLFWFLAVLVWVSANRLPLPTVRGPVPLSDLSSELGVEISLRPTTESLFPWIPRTRWRKWAWLHYQAARRAYQRGQWIARLAYSRAVGAACLARLILTGAITMAHLVDWLTHAQLRRNLGALPVLYAVLERLKVNEIITRHCPSQAEISHGTVAMVLILNRLMAPRALVRMVDWISQTVLTQTLTLPAAKFNDDRLGRTLDALAAHQREIWQDILHEALVRFDIDLNFIFYDLTAFVMQGEFEGSQMVDYGFAHNTPPGKKKIKQKLSTSQDGGIPLEYEMTSGRTADLATVQGTMDRLMHLLSQTGYRIAHVVIIGDRGTLNDEIALKYDHKGLKYLAGLNTQRKAHRRLLQAASEQDLYAHPLTTERGAQGLYGLECLIPFTHDGQTVCHKGLVVISGSMRSAIRRGRARHLRELREHLAAVRAKIGQPRCRTVKQVQSQAHTCLRKSPVGKLMRVEVTQSEQGSIHLHAWIDREALRQTMQTDGRYLLATNDLSLTPKAMLDLYRAKNAVETNFKIEKQVLRVRPMYVHSDKRIEGLMLISMLALLVYSLLEREMRQHGLALTTRRLIERLEDVSIIETQCWDGSCLQRLTPLTPDQHALMVFLDDLLHPFDLALPLMAKPSPMEELTLLTSQSRQIHSPIMQRTKEGI